MIIWAWVYVVMNILNQDPMPFLNQ